MAILENTMSKFIPDFLSDIFFKYVSWVLRNKFILTELYTNVFIGSDLSGSSLYCYQCSPGLPGCNSPFNWRGMGYLGTGCPEANDICVKLIEKKGADEFVTRDCLSNLQAFRTDIPADHYEGCRPASIDPRLSNYVNNTIKEYDVKRDYYDQTTWCFCFLDHRCNGSTSITISAIVLSLSIVCNFIVNKL